MLKCRHCVYHRSKRGKDRCLFVSHSVYELFSGLTYRNWQPCSLNENGDCYFFKARWWVRLFFPSIFRKLREEDMAWLVKSSRSLPPEKWLEKYEKITGKKVTEEPPIEL